MSNVEVLLLPPSNLNLLVSSSPAAAGSGVRGNRRRPAPPLPPESESDSPHPPPKRLKKSRRRRKKKSYRGVKGSVSGLIRACKPYAPFNSNQFLMEEYDTHRAGKIGYNQFYPSDAGDRVPSTTDLPSALGGGAPKIAGEFPAKDCLSFLGSTATDRLKRFVRSRIPSVASAAIDPPYISITRRPLPAAGVSSNSDTEDLQRVGRAIVKDQQPVIQDQLMNSREPGNSDDKVNVENDASANVDGPRVDVGQSASFENQHVDLDTEEADVYNETLFEDAQEAQWAEMCRQEFLGDYQAVTAQRLEPLSHIQLVQEYLSLEDEITALQTRLRGITDAERARGMLEGEDGEDEELQPGELLIDSETAAKISVFKDAIRALEIENDILREDNKRTIGNKEINSATSSSSDTCSSSSDVSSSSSSSDDEHDASPCYPLTQEDAEENDDFLVRTALIRRGHDSGVSCGGASSSASTSCEDIRTDVDPQDASAGTGTHHVADTRVVNTDIVDVNTAVIDVTAEDSGAGSTVLHSSYDSTGNSIRGCIIEGAHMEGHDGESTESNIGDCGSINGKSCTENNETLNLHSPANDYCGDLHNSDILNISVNETNTNSDNVVNNCDSGELE